MRLRISINSFSQKLPREHNVLIQNHSINGLNLQEKNVKRFLMAMTNGSGGIKRTLGNMLMFSPLKNVYGLSNLRAAYTGGDVMSGEIFNYFRGIGINLKKTLWNTESAGFICVQGIS